MSFALLRVCNNKNYVGYKNQLCFDEYISSLVFGIEIFEVLVEEKIYEFSRQLLKEFLYFYHPDRQ